MAHAGWLTVAALAAVAACSAPAVSSASPGSSLLAAPESQGAPGCPEGGALVASRSDLARLASCATLRGLTVRSGAALDVSVLHALTTITGDLVIGPTVAIEDVRLAEAVQRYVRACRGEAVDAPVTQ